jgi:hypothetical protein
MVGQVSAQFQSAVPDRHASYILRYDVVIVISRLPLIAGQPLAVTNDENANNQKQLCSRVSQKQSLSLSDQNPRKQAKWVFTLSMLASQRSVPRTSLVPCSRGGSRIPNPGANICYFRPLEIAISNKTDTLHLSREA